MTRQEKNVIIKRLQYLISEAILHKQFHKTDQFKCLLKKVKKA